MSQQWKRRLSKCHLVAFSTLVFHHGAVFLLLTRCCGGQFQMVGPSNPVYATLGDDVMLPCHLEPATDVSTKTLEWSRLDLNPRFVHVRRDGVELLVSQNPAYVGRTSLSSSRLKHGDVSLELSNVKVSDDGNYRCHIPAVGTSAVQLAVGAVSSPVVIIAEIDKVSGRLVLQCESAGWYPEPEVLWLDVEGHVLSAGPTETVRGPDDLYTVSSRVTVDKRHSNSFTCRVQQNHINQTRETQIQISEDVFSAPSCSAVRIAVIVSVCFLLSCVCAALFVYGRQTRNRGDKKMQHENKSEDGAGESGEGEQLVEGRTNRRDSDEQKLQEKQEEKTKIEHVISVLMEQKTELDTTRAKHRSELTKVEEDRKKNEKKLEKIDHEFNVKKDAKKNELLIMKQQLDNEKTECQKSLQKIAQQLEKTEDIITIMTELKRKAENQVEQMKIQIEKKKREREKRLSEKRGKQKH